MEATLYLVEDGGALARVDDVTFDAVEQVFLDIHARIPDQVARLLREGRDPFRYSYALCDRGCAVLFTIAFRELLPIESSTARPVHDPVRRSPPAVPHPEIMRTIAARARSQRLCRQSDALKQRSAALCSAVGLAAERAFDAARRVRPLPLAR